MAVATETIYVNPKADAKLVAEMITMLQEVQSTLDPSSVQVIPTDPAMAAPIEEAAAPAVDLPPAELPIEEEEPAAKARYLDLQRWEAKALKKPGKVVPFASDALSPDDMAWIKAGLEGAPIGEIKSLFDAMKKAPGDDLTEREKVLYEKVKRVLAKYGDDVAAQIVRGDQVDLSGLEAPLRNALLADLTAVALEVMGSLADSIGPDFDPATMGGKAAEWARGYTYDLVRGLTDSSRKTVQQATAAFFSDGLSSKDVAALLSPAFGARRSETIAITELTRSATAATEMYQTYLKEAGLLYDMQWLTSNDERSGKCAICGPRNGTIQGEAWSEPPPAHPRCRCRAVLVRRKK